MKKVLDYDAETKTVEYIHLDGTGEAVIESIQDCEEIIEYNQQMAGLHDPKQEFWRVGTIPMSICLQWSQECGAKPFTKEWQEYAQKRVQDRDYAKLNPNRIKM